MKLMILLIVSLGFIILAIEVTLWMLLQHQLRSLRLPHSMDRSSIRIFSAGRLSIIAVAHTLFLLVSALLPLWLLW